MKRDSKKNKSVGPICYKNNKRVLCNEIKPRRTMTASGNVTSSTQTSKKTTSQRRKEFAKETWDEMVAVAPGILTATGVFHLLDEVGTRAYLSAREKIRQEINKGIKRNQGFFKWAKSNPISYKPVMDPAPYLHKVMPAGQAAKARLRGGIKGALWFIPIVAGVNLYNRRKSGFGKKKKTQGNLRRWFDEQWVDVCSPTSKGFKPCGRKTSTTKRKYPYCRPLKRKGRGTPKTAKEIIKEVGGKKKLKERCKKKRAVKTKTLRHRWEK